MSKPHTRSPLVRFSSVRSPLAGEHDAIFRVGGGKTAHATKNAQTMRKHPTDAERMLWSRLNRKQLGYKFRRQQPVGKYIVDFYNAEKRLVIELDGSQHLDNYKDDERSHWLTSQGLKILRFWNNDVMQNIDAVLEQIIQTLQTTPHAVSYETAAPPQGGSGNAGIP